MVLRNPVRGRGLWKRPLSVYRNGAEGMIKWVEDYVNMPIYPPGDPNPIWFPIGRLEELPPVAATGKTYKDMWESQKEVLREALSLGPDGLFKYRLIVFCWPRGEGKSAIAVLIQLWKFFCWIRQQIMLGANSKDQTRFVHFDIMKDIIINSPSLFEMIGGHPNIQEKEIHIRDSEGVVRSIIRPISSFSGILSNISGYTFSEIFDMKNPRFFTQLDGSVRNVPNALGVIDSTVSARTHILYQLYQKFVAGKIHTVYFSYRYSKNGNPEDYWNPNMDEKQLNDYREKFLFSDFERYFLNLWSAGANTVFTESMIDEMSYLEVDNEVLNHKAAKEVATNISIKREQIEEAKLHKWHSTIVEADIEIGKQSKRVTKRVDDAYIIGDPFGNVMFPTCRELGDLGKLLDTDWAVLSGADFDDPYATRGYARSVLTIIAKGLPGSKSNPLIMTTSEVSQAVPNFVYFLLYLNVMDSGDAVKLFKEILGQIHDEYGGVDMFCAERYGASEVFSWCESESIPYEYVYPSYSRQKDAFNPLLRSAINGLFKVPTIYVPGSKMDNILREELLQFTHDPDEKWFGSKEKKEKYGAQDDVVYAIGWALYGGRNIGPSMFRSRSGDQFFGSIYYDRNVIGDYSS